MQDYSIRTSLNVKGFTLLEILVAVAILSVSLFAILQGQADNIFIVETTKKRLIAQKYIRVELCKAERNYKEMGLGKRLGEFFPPHELAGDRWELTVDEQEVFGFKIKRVTYEIFWKERNRSKSLKARIFIN